MAAPITHIVLARELLDTQPYTLSKRDFFIGTSFPDIRYLGAIERSKTHNPKTTLNDVLNAKNAFQSGLLFHSLVDKVREKIMQDSGIYLFTPKSKYVIYALKSVEDEILFDKINDWSEIRAYMDNILDEEMTFQIKKDDLKKWHTMLKNYFTEKPNKDARKKFFTTIDFDEEIIEKIENAISSVKKNENVMKILENVYSDFNSLLKLQSF